MIVFWTSSFATLTIFLSRCHLFKHPFLSFFLLSPKPFFVRYYCCCSLLLMMSRGGGGGGNESFLWENQLQTWGLSNSDSSRGNEEKPRNKQLLPVSRSNSLAEIIGKVEPSPVSKKRGGGELVKKTGKGSAGDEANKEGKSGESDHEIHIWTERERRKKMRSMFSNLHALLPQLPPKADKSTIVDEAVSYIKTLQHTLQKLQKQKLEKLQGSMTFSYEPSSSIVPQTKQTDSSSRELFLADQGSSSNLATAPANISPSLPRYPVLFQTWTSSNVVLNICGDEAQISICSPKKPGLFTTICYLLEKHHVELLSAHVSSDCNRTMLMIQVHRAIGGTEQFAESVPVEEIYRQVACEIMCWVSSC